VHHVHEVQKSGKPPSQLPLQIGGGQNEIVVPQPSTPPSRPLLGILGRPIVFENGSLGMQVGQVFPGSPAQRVGLEPGDVIARVDGTPFVTPNDMNLALGRSNGRPVLTVFRVRHGQYVDVLTPLY
jgi:S1-C subfamily serine protease